MHFSFYGTFREGVTSRRLHTIKNTTRGERKRGMHVPQILQFHIPAVQGGVVHTFYLLAQFKYFAVY